MEGSYKHKCSGMEKQMKENDARSQMIQAEFEKALAALSERLKKSDLATGTLQKLEALIREKNA